MLAQVTKTWRISGSHWRATSPMPSRFTGTVRQQMTCVVVQSQCGHQFLLLTLETTESSG